MAKARSGSAVLFGLFLTALLAGLALLGGIAVQASDPTEVQPVPALQVWCAAAAALVALGAGFVTARRWRRDFLFSLVLAALLAAVTAGLCETVAGRFVPPWPALGLHGVAPSASGAWAYRAGERPGAVGVNSWGQRDLERGVLPPRGRRRVLFIGDSFLEESAAVPLPLAVERRLDRADLEVVNLGVSATDPDEYYWRLRTIGLALRPSHAVVVLFAGNDFVSGPSLPTRWGLTAPYPKRSVLSALRLRSLNHLLSNRDRPVIRIWGAADERQRAESDLHAAIRGAGDAELPRLLADLAPEPLRRPLAEHLRQLDLGAFFAGLREPDGGLFRSYYLRAALQSSGPLGADPLPADPEWARYAVTMVRRMAELCRAEGIAFTLVLAPEATQVDPRFRRFWGQVSTFPRQSGPLAGLSQELVAAARRDGVTVVDLRVALRGVEGAYLNLDGHWSELGVETAAAALARHLAAWAGSSR